MAVHCRLNPLKNGNIDKEASRLLLDSREQITGNSRVENNLSFVRMRIELHEPHSAKDKKDRDMKTKGNRISIFHGEGK